MVRAKLAQRCECFRREQQHDKRDTERDRDAKREVEKAMKQNRR